MNAIRPFRIPLAALALVGAALLGTGAACAGGSLPVHDVNGVIYVSGGVGKDESTFLRSVQTQWPASFEFAARAGQKSDFVAGVVVSLFDAQGRALLDQVVTDGPMMLARLAPGRYKVQATLDGRTLTRDIDVPRTGTSHNLFLWPQGTDMASAG
ncbi:hypothetical protein [Variovorax sp. OV329]|uniref:hypothetical protein n=1 Tax=Variovorax sp. OV329 TaxID=1882825 RepID=UPI0008EA7E71|nr:hypothetical protein [Variovorax sp. OV329]SFM93279.1 hypothetical protein SAMN05444747_111105 [Variovorax sp. OV329]